MNKILIDKSAVELALSALSEWYFGGLNGSESHDAAITALQKALAQPQQEPVFCEHCGGNDEDPQDHCMDCTRPRWEPVTQELLNQQHPWLYEPMWIAMKGGTVLQGIYEWRQGRNPDRFITDGGDDWAFDAAYVMPIVQPKPPTAKVAHGIKENT